LVSFKEKSLGGGTEQGEGKARRFPARRVTGREGKVGEEQEEAESYL
jgi:hypothetical protein